MLLLLVLKKKPRKMTSSSALSAVSTAVGVHRVGGGAVARGRRTVPGMAKNVAPTTTRTVSSSSSCRRLTATTASVNYHDDGSRRRRGSRALRRAAVDADAADAEAPPTLEASAEEVAEMMSSADGGDAEKVPDKIKTIPKKAVERDLAKEVESRRTFAIISHPDAGKTTLTEKLLYYGGAIQEAGAVRARRGAKAATSDWMEMEKQRGISISSTALSFAYRGFTLNLLDTPGHADFSEAGRDGRPVRRSVGRPRSPTHLPPSLPPSLPPRLALHHVCFLSCRSRRRLFTFWGDASRARLTPGSLKGARFRIVKGVN